eukprot:TRINITY_DN13146_c0_g1_i1.p1 TRINITY_DN13146_c0_g1~~TRINITY_DN13146_c0_g1_i1.p1  ORF type:complete len:488 (-),score=84.08 TRINITY_DN13146_c0_g1_i1:40-1347(-)
MNEVLSNFVVYVTGTGGRATERRVLGDFAFEGTGFWSRGPNNIFRNNVAANVICTGPWGFGFTFYQEYVGEVPMPTQPGQTPAEYTGTDVHDLAIREFVGNEVYGAVQGGLTIWWVGSFGDDPRSAVGESEIKDFTIWHHYGMGFYGYPANRITFQNVKIRGDRGVLANRYENPVGIHNGDYMVSNLRVLDSDIQSMRLGVEAPVFMNCRSCDTTTNGYTIVRDSFLRNWVNVHYQTSWSVNGADGLPHKRMVVENVVFGTVPVTCGNGCGAQYDVKLVYSGTGSGRNVVVLDEMVVIDYNGTSGDTFQVYYREQVSEFVVPQTGPSENDPSGRPIVGSPDAGKTNQENWNEYGLAIAGGITPCTDDSTRPSISGYTCCISAKNVPELSGSAQYLCDGVVDGDGNDGDGDATSAGSKLSGVLCALFGGFVCAGYL